MIVALKGFIKEFDIDISKYSNFESRQFKSVSAQAGARSVRHCLRPQSEAIDYTHTNWSLGQLSQSLKGNWFIHKNQHKALKSLLAQIIATKPSSKNGMSYHDQ